MLIKILIAESPEMVAATENSLRSAGLKDFVVAGVHNKDDLIFAVRDGKANKFALIAISWDVLPIGQDEGAELIRLAQTLKGEGFTGRLVFRGLTTEWLATSTKFFEAGFDGLYGQKYGAGLVTDVRRAIEATQPN